MKTIRKNLTDEQKNRGVIFSSCLSTNRIELESDTIHEVFENDKNKFNRIDLLSDVSFFKNSHFKFHIIRQN